MKLSSLLACALLVGTVMLPAHADKLDDIVKAGKLRCAVVLDFPPMGSRDAKNTPVGFDVDYCKDLAKALGVEPVIVETPFPDRIPALLSGRADVGVSSTSDTLERAKSIGFSIPYFVFKTMVVTRKDAGINKFDDLKGRPVGGTAGNFETLALQKAVTGWNDPKAKFRSFQNQADVFLALSQKQIDATAVTNTVAASVVKTDKSGNLKIAGEAPFDLDYVSLITLRNEQGLLNYLNLFVNRQVRTGRYAELYKQWIGTEGGPAPDLANPAVYR